jgi:glycosyltransferase involved in cell wall biosynthesis
MFTYRRRARLIEILRTTMNSAHSPNLRSSVTADLATSAPAGGPVIMDALAARYGGAAYGTVQLAHFLADDPALNEIIVLARKGSLVAEGIRPRRGLRPLALPEAKRFELGRRLLWEAFGLPELSRRRSASSVMTWSGMLPRRLDARVICYLANPVIFERNGAANRLRRWAVSRTARHAAHVLVPSSAMAALVTKALDLRPQVVPLGVDHTRFKPASSPGTELLCVADFYRHKRHDVLLDAWAALPSPRPTLRLIGNPRVDRTCYRSVAAQAAQYRALGAIVLHSGLSLDQLIDAYRRARLFALASEHESFGLTLLEAQACGVPAVVRDLPALRETGGEGTTYVAGDDAAAWAVALQRLLTDDVGHSAARAAGLEHARRYSWEQTADAVRARLLPERSEV